MLRSGDVQRRGSEENAKEREEWISGAFCKLVRALGEGGGLCLGQATATARWRPAGCSGRRGMAVEHQRETKGGGEASVRRVEASASRDVAGRALHGVGGGALHSGGERQSRGAGGRGKGLKRNF